MSKKESIDFVNADEFEASKEPRKNLLEEHEKLQKKYTKKGYKKKLNLFGQYKQHKQYLFSNFSEIEKKVFFLYFEKDLSGPEVAEKLNIGNSMPCYYVRKLEKKIQFLQKVAKSRPHSSNSIENSNKITNKKPQKKDLQKPQKKETKIKEKNTRLHAQQYVIKIKSPSVKYCKLVRRGIRQKIINGETLKFHKNKIEIYSYKSFWGETSKESTEESVTYFSRLFSTLENDLNLILVKERGENITQVNNHYALVGCEFAKQYYEIFGEHLRYLDKNGKTRLHTDKSKGNYETETSNAQTAQDDIDLVRHSYDEIFNTELMNRTQTTHTIGQLAKGLNAVVMQMSNLIKTQNTTVQMLQVYTGGQINEPPRIKNEPFDVSKLEGGYMFM